MRRLAVFALILGVVGVGVGRSVPMGRARLVAPNAKPTPKPTPTPSPTPSPTPTPPPGGFESERVWGSYDDWEPAVATDPSSGYVYQLTTRYNGPVPCTGCKPPWIIFRSSSDGGATWSADQFLSKAKKTHNDPQIEVAQDGAIYAVWLHEYVPGVKFTKSVDHGVTWSTPIAIAAGGQPSFSDKPILAVSQDGRHVYIAFNASDAWIVASHDYGTSFSAPKKITSDTRYWFHSGGAVAPNGDVYFAATDYSQDYTGDANVNVQRSTDFGVTWSTVRVDTSKQAPPCAWSAGCYLGFFGPTIGLAVDASGKLAVAYNVGSTAGGQPSFSDKPILAISGDGRHVYIAFNASDSWIVASHDFGTSFTAPKKITTDTRYWFHSGGAVAPNGDVYFAATDYSQDYTGDANVNVQRSTDFGATWSTVRIDTSKQAPPCAWSAGCYLGFFGPTIGLAVDASGKIAVAYNVGSAVGGAEKMYFRTSSDRGLTWSARQEIGSTAAGVNHGFACVAAGPGSDDFRVAWQDDRNGSHTAFDTWYRRTTNSGSTWSAALRLSNATSGASYKNANGYAFPYGDYFEMAVDASGRNHLIWGEGTSYNGPGGVWYTRGQ